MDALHAWGNNERALKQALQRRVHTIHAEFRKRARAGEENGDDEESPSGVAPSSDRPSGVADESVPLAAARAQLSAVCALAESAAQKRSDGTLGNPDGSLWRDFSARVSAECGHALPPNVGATVARLRFCEPAPHDLVQVDHAPKVLVTQWIGHAPCEHERVSSRYGHA